MTRTSAKPSSASSSASSSATSRSGRTSRCSLTRVPDRLRPSPAGPPHDERLGAVGAAHRPLPRAHGHDLAGPADGEHPAAEADRVPHRLQLLAQLPDPGAQGPDLVLQLEDALDAGEADAILMGEPLQLAQQGA